MGNVCVARAKVRALTNPVTSNASKPLAAIIEDVGDDAKQHRLAGLFESDAIVATTAFLVEKFRLFFELGQVIGISVRHGEMG